MDLRLVQMLATSLVSLIKTSGTTLGAMYEFQLGTYDGTELG